MFAAAVCLTHCRYCTCALWKDATGHGCSCSGVGHTRRRRHARGACGGQRWHGAAACTPAPGRPCHTHTVCHVASDTVCMQCVQAAGGHWWTPRVGTQCTRVTHNLLLLPPPVPTCSLATQRQHNGVSKLAAHTPTPSPPPPPAHPGEATTKPRPHPPPKLAKPPTPNDAAACSNSKHVHPRRAWAAVGLAAAAPVGVAAAAL